MVLAPTAIFTTSHSSLAIPRLLARRSNVIPSPHAAAPHPRSRKSAIVGTALADAVSGMFRGKPGRIPSAPRNASAKADPTNALSSIVGAAQPHEDSG